MGAQVYHCETCGKKHLQYHSCHHRACPQRAKHKQHEWSRKQEAKLLATSYYMLTFILPGDPRGTCYKNQQWFHDAMFDAMRDTPEAFALDKKLVAPDGVANHRTPGFTAVPHTWTRQMEYHPHLHVVMPGLGLGPIIGFQDIRPVPCMSEQHFHIEKLLHHLNHITGRPVAFPQGNTGGGGECRQLVRQETIQCGQLNPDFPLRFQKSGCNGFGFQLVNQVVLLDHVQHHARRCELAQIQGGGVVELEMTAARHAVTIPDGLLVAREGFASSHFFQHFFKILPCHRANDVDVNGEPVNIRQMKQNTGSAAENEGQASLLKMPGQGQGINALFENLRGTAAHGFRLRFQPILFECAFRKHFSNWLINAGFLYFPALVH